MMFQCFPILIISALLAMSRAVLGAPVVSIVGRQIRIDNVPFHMKGVNWNPVGKGGVHPQGLDFRGAVDRDAQLMADAGINVVRTYEPLTDTVVLDKLWSHGIYVVNTVYAYGGAATSTVQNIVNAVKDHPATLMWAIGNEWNYNNLYWHEFSFTDAKTRIKEVARLVKQYDTSHPVSTIYGELPDAATLADLQDVDVWGINVYRDIGFGNLFEDWASRSGKPMYLGEYGADAYDARINSENQDAQAEATTKLTELIVAQSAVNSGGICTGGIIFEFADEWWKDGAGSPSTHDVGGIAPGGGPYPDLTFNEEWWGLVDIDRQPRKAYTAYANVAIPASTGTKPTCDDVLSVLAGGYTCGARIQYMREDDGMSVAQARDYVAREFPNECGACASVSKTTTKTITPTTTRPVETCETVWNNDAAGFSCGSRIEWLKLNRGMTDRQAGNTVAREFPNECGACRESSPAPTPTPAPNPSQSSTTSSPESIPSTPPPVPCEDLHQHCWFWQGLGFCSGAWEDSMKYWCRNTCDYCNQPVFSVAANMERPPGTKPALPGGPTSADLWQGIGSEPEPSLKPREDLLAIGVASLSVRSLSSCMFYICIVAYVLL
jgi:hypothetical protein